MPRPLIEVAPAGSDVATRQPLRVDDPADAPHIVSPASDSDPASHWQNVERDLMPTKFYYRCSTCDATFSSPRELERCLNIRRGRPCPGSLTLDRRRG